MRKVFGFIVALLTAVAVQAATLVEVPIEDGAVVVFDTRAVVKGEASEGAFYMAETVLVLPDRRVAVAYWVVPVKHCVQGRGLALSFADAELTQFVARSLWSKDTPDGVSRVTVALCLAGQGLKSV